MLPQGTHAATVRHNGTIQPASQEVSVNNNESLVARRQAAVARGVSMAHPVFIERAENALL